MPVLARKVTALTYSMIVEMLFFFTVVQNSDGMGEMEEIHMLQTVKKDRPGSIPWIHSLVGLSDVFLRDFFDDRLALRIRGIGIGIGEENLKLHGVPFQ